MKGLFIVNLSAGKLIRAEGKRRAKGKGRMILPRL